MFFGSGAREEVPVDRLEELANSLFEKKLGRFAERAGSIIKAIESARAEFEAACDRLEALDEEPSVEGIEGLRAGYAKAQKAAYARAMGRTMKALSLDAPGSANSYLRYKAIASNLESTTTEILKTNHIFKLVMYLYSNHMSPVKKPFSAIEEQTGALKDRLGAASIEFSEYTKLSREISQLMLEGEAIGSLHGRIGGIRKRVAEKNTTEMGRAEARISELLSGKKLELALLDQKLSALLDGVERLILPLGRVSRRFDHYSMGKKQLSIIISDLEGNIRHESDYAEFAEIVAKLREHVADGKLEVRNREETLKAIDGLTNADVYAMLLEIRKVRDQKGALRDAIRREDQELAALKTETIELSRSKEEITELEAKIRETAAALATRKAAIEGLFKSYYRKPISITL